MPHHRLLPLLIVGAACLPLAACGSDDEPAATEIPSNAPAQTTATAPGDTTADAPSADPTETPEADDDAQAKAPTESGAGAGESSPEDGAAAADPADPNDAGKGSSSTKDSPSSKKPSGSSGTSRRAPKSKPAEEAKVPKVLDDYAKGGAPATADQAQAVRDTMLGFQDALVAQDAGKACSYTLGLPAKSDPSKPSPSCETLIEGSKMAPPTDQDKEMIRTAKITVNGDRASIEMGDSGMPMPFRNVDGRWRIDYGTLLGTGGSAG